jgi:hypothetical protein
LKDFNIILIVLKVVFITVYTSGNPSFKSCEAEDRCRRAAKLIPMEHTTLRNFHHPTKLSNNDLYIEQFPQEYLGKNQSQRLQLLSGALT